MVTMQKNFKFVRGDSFNFAFVINNSAGNPLTVNEAYFSCKANIDDLEYVFQKDLSDGIELVIDRYNVRIAPEDTENLVAGKYYYDLEVVINEDVYTLMLGQLDLISDITRRTNDG